MYHQFSYCPEEIIKSCKRKTFNPKDVIISEQSGLNEIFFVLEGIINIKYLDNNGYYIVASHFMPGDYIGDTHVLLNRNYEFVAQALSQVTVAIIPADAFKTLIATDYKIVQSILQSYHNRVIFLESYALVAKGLSLYEQAILFFLGPMKQEPLRKFCTKEYLVEYFNTDIRCINRIIAAFTKKGIVSVKNKRFIWEEDKMMQEAAEFNIDYHANLFISMFIEDIRPKFNY